VQALLLDTLESGERRGHPVQGHESSVRAFVPVSP
jgi:hypothetical protein